MKKFWFQLFVIVFLLYGCGEETKKPLASSSQTGETGKIVLNVTWPQSIDANKRAGTPQYPTAFVSSFITAYLYSSAGEKIKHTDLKHEGNRGIAEIKVVAGDDYRLELVYFDQWTEGDIIVYVGMKENIDVVAEETTTVDITMVTATPTLYPAEMTGKNSFSISWSSVLFAISYSLGEDTSLDFSFPTTVYSGSDTTIAFTDKASGIYYYSVYAETTYGTTYSNEPIKVEAGDIATILINIPWPE